ncbi:MAG: DUF2442 domain-containing protein [Gemmatimonadota bacterium]
MPRPSEVRALSRYRLWLRFDDGVEGEVDLSRFVGRGVFARWEDPEAFDAVHIGEDGQIAWDEVIEMCADALYLEITGKKPEELFPGLAAAPTRA